MSLPGTLSNAVFALLGGSVVANAELVRLAQLTVNGIVVGSVLALAAVGLTMVYGILRIANFAHGDLLTLGGYLALSFLALVALPTTLALAAGLAVVLLGFAAVDRWLPPRIGRASSLSGGELRAFGCAAAALLVLSAGVVWPARVPGGVAALVVAVLLAVPWVRGMVVGEGGIDRGRVVVAVLVGLATGVLAHLLVPLQVGPGGVSLAAEAAVGVASGVAVLAGGHQGRARDRWTVVALTAAGAVALFLFAGWMLLAIVLAVAAVALFSVLIERLVWRRARRQGAGLLTLIIISIGLMLALRNTIVLAWGTRQRAFPASLQRGESILGSDVLITPYQALAVAVALVVILALHGFLRKAKMGKAMRALADNMDLARISGVRVDRVVVYVWIISGALAALAGILYGLVRPFDPNLGWYQLLPIFAAVILGGIGSPYGALLGGFTIGIAMEVSPFFGVPIDYKLAVGFGILILVMIFRPRGLLGAEGVR